MHGKDLASGVVWNRWIAPDFGFIFIFYFLKVSSLAAVSRAGDSAAALGEASASRVKRFNAWTDVANAVL